MKRRASTLLTVLLAVAAMGFLALSMASALLSHYQLAVRYRDSAQADLCARAGLAEFLYRSDQLQATADVTAVPEPLLPRFKPQPVLLQPTQHLPARVTLILEGPHASRDNTLSPLPAQSSYDGPGKTSVPPFSLDLVLKVEWAARVFYYQALVQQRWPYALAAPGPIRILGKADGGYYPGAPSRVKGSVLAFAGPAVGQWQGTSVDVEVDFYQQLLPSSMTENAAGRISIGGPFHLPAVSIQQSGDNPPEYIVTEGTDLYSRGARLEGNAETYDNALSPQLLPTSPVVVGEDSVLTGQIHLNRHLGGLNPLSEAARRRMARLFDAPQTEGWTDIQNAVQEWAQRESSRKNLLITSNTAATSGPELMVIVVPGGRARCRRLETMTDHCLILDNCSLACDENLRLRSRDPQGDREILRGISATLVVGGELLLDRGELDAGGKGMVIFAHHFLIRASGSYRGSIIAPYGGAFFGQVQAGSAVSQTTGLHIQGGVLLGSNSLSFQVQDRVVSTDPVSIVKGLPPRLLRCPTLAATELTHDPQYLRGLNQFGSFQLKQLIRR